MTEDLGPPTRLSPVVRGQLVLRRIGRRTPKQLTDWGFIGNILSFVHSFLSRQSFRVLIGNSTSRTYQEETEVPQRSVLAGTLFLDAMNFNGPPKNIRTQAAISAVHRCASSVAFTNSARKSVRGLVCNGRHRLSGPSLNIFEQPFPNH